MCRQNTGTATDSASDEDNDESFPRSSVGMLFYLPDAAMSKYVQTSVCMRSHAGAWERDNILYPKVGLRVMIKMKRLVVNYSGIPK